MSLSETVILTLLTGKFDSMNDATIGQNGGGVGGVGVGDIIDLTDDVY